MKVTLDSGKMFECLEKMCKLHQKKNAWYPDVAKSDFPEHGEYKL